MVGLISALTREKGSVSLSREVGRGKKKRRRKGKGEERKGKKKGRGKKKVSLYLLRKVVSQLPWTIRIPRFSYTVARLVG